MTLTSDRSVKCYPNGLADTDSVTVSVTDLHHTHCHDIWCKLPFTDSVEGSGTHADNNTPDNLHFNFEINIETSIFKQIGMDHILMNVSTKVVYNTYSFEEIIKSTGLKQVKLKVDCQDCFKF